MGALNATVWLYWMRAGPLRLGVLVFMDVPRGDARMGRKALSGGWNSVPLSVRVSWFKRFQRVFSALHGRFPAVQGQGSAFAT